MAATIPSYIPAGRYGAAPIRHAWSDYDPFDVLGTIEDPVMDTLSRVSGRARVAFAIAAAEWVIARFGPANPDPRPLLYLEAQWARMIDLALGRLDEFPRERWEGRVRGPIGLARDTVTNCQYALVESGEGVFEAGLVALIARHVLPEQGPFSSWQAAALDRLEAHYPTGLYPVTRQDVWGPPVPRGILDPAIDLAANPPSALAKGFVAGLDFGANPFLNPPPAGGP